VKETKIADFTNNFESMAKNRQKAVTW